MMRKEKKKKPWWKKVRKPVPEKTGGPMMTKKGAKGYQRRPKHKKHPQDYADGEGAFLL